MYKKLTPLKFKDHKDLRVKSMINMRYASGEIMVPIIIDEISHIAREYPIVFMKNSDLPLALMGVEKGKNAYINQDGSWRANYIPAHLKHYPFALVEIRDDASKKEVKIKKETDERKDKSKKLAVLVDVESEWISKDSGTSIYDENGEFSEKIKPTIELMKKLAQKQNLTKELVKTLDEFNLLTEITIQINDTNVGKKNITGLRTINEKKLNQLKDDDLLKLRQKGALPLVYAALLSWSNFTQGPIGKSHPIKQSPQIGEEVLKF